MSILVDKNTKLVVQGITGREGRFHTEQMIAYGTDVVAGVTPGKGGQEAAGVPVFNTVREAVKEAGANASIIFVPPAFAADAVLEAIDAGISVVVAITEGIPVHDMLRVVRVAEVAGTTLIGPNCPGVISPGKTKLGILPGDIFKPGPVGIISRSGTLTYEVVNELTENGLGQSTCIGVGGDPVIGTSFADLLPMFEEDPETEAVVLIGEIGGSDEETACEYIHRMKKPVIGFISGLTAPEGKRMGHAGAIISGGQGTPESKLKALRGAKVPIADNPAHIAELTAEILKKQQGRIR
ncbi:MAG: succinate--CoA ligase subunit alpha [bacterium]